MSSVATSTLRRSAYFVASKSLTAILKSSVTTNSLLLPSYVVRREVMFSQVCVCSQGGLAPGLWSKVLSWGKEGGTPQSCHCPVHSPIPVLPGGGYPMPWSWLAAAPPPLPGLHQDRGNPSPSTTTDTPRLVCLLR